MIDFSPAPKAALWPSQVWAHALIEARLIARNGEQLLLALVIPVTLLIVGRFYGDRLGLSLSSVVASVFALAIWSTCFTSLAIVTGFERRYGVLERLSATSLGRSGLLAGKAGAISLVAGGQALVLAIVALGIGWRPNGLSWPVLPSLLLAAMAFASLALALGGSMRAEATLGLANLIYLLGLGAGILVPAAYYPEAAQTLVLGLPTMALGETLRYGTPTGLIVLGIWTVGASLLARKVFTWTS